MKNNESSKHPVGEVRPVRVAEVVVPAQRMRPLGDIRPIMDSISEINLIEPIVVRRDTMELISGLHRLEAFRALGRDEILARLIDVTDFQAAMVEIDENLVRIELTALQRAEHIHRRKELYEAMHPEAKHGGAPGKPGGGKQKSKGERAASFAADTAQKTGLSPRTVQEDVQVAKLTPEAKSVVKGTPLENKKRELLALARLPKEKQAMTARAVASAEAATVVEAAQKSHGKRKVPVQSSAKPAAVEIVSHRSTGVAVVTRTVTKVPERCWACGAPSLNPCNHRGTLARGPSGELVEVTYEYEPEELRQIKVIAHAISGANVMIEALGTLPPGEERSRLAREAVDVITKGLQTLNGIVSPMHALMRDAA
ncbi:ParB/RepB/Spo0J family partition protein [Sorangium sp. So ce1182]|uniref:ParB/RepB/Spo0J family partition protein n=1 Tax=Sorangium sp. So ce1182 TaxID=3133334 RepID=UPI003F61FF9D